MSQRDVTAGSDPTPAMPAPAPASPTGGDKGVPLPADATLDKVREYFSQDLFATRAGCVVVQAAPGHAVVELPLQDDLHRNAHGAVMGGAIFTLADFALAVASNVGQAPTVSVSNQIEFLSAARGQLLTATCDADKSGRALGFYTVDVRDELGIHVARMTATCFRHQPRR